MVLEETVHLFFIRQPFLSCWLKIRNYQKLAWEVRLSFWDKLSISVYGMTELNFGINWVSQCMRLRWVQFLGYGSKYFSIWDEFDQKYFRKLFWQGGYLRLCRAPSEFSRLPPDLLILAAGSRLWSYKSIFLYFHLFRQKCISSTSDTNHRCTISSFRANIGKAG